MFRDITPTNPKAIGTQTLNFKPYYKRSPLKFYEGPRPSLWCVLASLAEFLAHVKI